MSLTLVAIALCVAIVALIVGLIVFKKVPRKLKSEKFIADWKELQAYCKDKATWPDAIQAADKLFDKALKKRRFKGKSMGERMVSAQRKINNNDQMWFAHNLAKKVAADPSMKLKEVDVKQALIGFRQALKDLGALGVNEQPVSETPAADEKKASKK